MGQKLELRGFKVQRIKYLILLILLSNHAAAQLPNVFERATLAKASEVNQNFSFLDDKITNGFKCVTPTNGLKFTYERKDVPIGSIVNAGHNTFIIIKLSFIDFASGERYHLTVPSATFPSDVLAVSTMSINYNIANPKNFCSVGVISGYPVNSLRFDVDTKVTYFANLNLNNINIRIIKKFEILVGGTIVRFTIGAVLRTQANVFIDPANGDYTQLFDVNNMAAPASFIQEVDDLIDTIIIEKAP